jgi:4-amino-4-deoxy-L-arabinose transferase-like glycosyltransferase
MTDATTYRSPKFSTRRLLIGSGLLTLTLIAACLRIWRLGDIPAGLHFDEAAQGLLIQDHIFRGETPVFFSSYTGHEALFHYTQAPFLALLGPTNLALRLPAALWSIALVPVVYLLGAQFWGWRPGLMAALATACAGWSQHIGRIGFRANSLPVVSGLAILCLYRALNGGRRRDWLLSGALFGLSLYTYLAVRALPLLGLLLLIYLLIWDRPALWRNRSGIGLFTLMLLLVSVPLAVHMLHVPSDLLERTRQISLTAEGGSRLQTLLAQTWATLGMFSVRGARDGFFNLPFRPVFPGIAALPFYAGVLLALWRWRGFASVLTLGWLGVMLLPTLLAVDAPHWLRAIGAMPATYLLWGLGAGAAWEWLARRWRHGLLAGAVGAAAITGAWTYVTAHEYFAVWAKRPEVYYDYMQYAMDAAREAAKVPSDQGLLISENYYHHASYLFLAPRTRSAQWFDARHAVVWPRVAPWTSILSATTPPTPDLQPLLVQARGEPYAPNGAYVYMKLHGDTIPPFDPPQPLQARFGDLLELRGANLSGALQPREKLHLQLWAGALGGVDRELRIFVHLEDENGRIVAQDDALGYDAREWRPGDQFINFHDLQLPDTLPSGKLRLIAGLYDAVTGARYPVSGTGAQGDFVNLPLPPQ